ncbi:receptor-type tyrosine-protein phosphatase eta isoform X2 [Monodon monoceros]|uniref:receptor-type tyrosine-protein phosphatase eta isoform X2 n=1 Tax=Monodon monoceros TaxID=40151 RepID=UPI0010F7F03A|nr:receptor-type tyrosine-protein phosphatase eta isoform X2 [Monodon monoceros]
MTRGGGSRSRRSRDQGAERGGWAPLAPPCEAPARPGTRPPRCSPARLRRVAAAAAAAAMSPGKPGAGGAGTRRTGWRRRRRRRRLEAATRAPGLGRTVGPDSRVPGTFQGARGMKQAAREARPPPRSPRLRWALPPLLLLLRLGQILCTGDCSRCDLVEFTSTASEIQSPIKAAGNFSVINVTDLSGQSQQFLRADSDGKTSFSGLVPGMRYLFTLSNGSSTCCQEVQIQPSPTEAVTISPTSVTLTWKNDTAGVTSTMENGQMSLANQTGGNSTYSSPGSNGTSGDTTLDASNTDRFLQPPGSPTAPGYKYRLESAAPSSDPSLPQDTTEVLLFGLKSDTQYKATVYPRAANGAEGQPRATEFKTNSSQVFDIKVVNISATGLTLTWKINENESSSVYTYKIQVAGETDPFNLTVHETCAVITPLNSSTLYSITVWPFPDNSSEGIPGFLQVYTPPSPVSDFRVTSVSTREIGLAWNSNDSNSFEIHITAAEVGVNQTTTEQSIVIGGLSPGTEYRFDIFPQGPNGTKGDSQTIYSTTDPSAVFDIRVVNVTTTDMQLAWQNTDNVTGYIYCVVIQSEHSSNQTNSSHEAITLGGLIPGTLYNITIFPEMKNFSGKSNSTVQYTRPSDVSNIEVRTNTTAATLNWQNFDEASFRYTYRLLMEQDGNASKATQIVTGVGITYATVTELTPGSSYTVEIFTQVGNVTESLAPGWQSFCTDPAPVTSFHCEVVPKEPTLVLKWACPFGINTGFELEVSHGDWENMTNLESCSSENGSEYRTEVTYLNFSTLYNITITARSCNKMASPTQNTCLTGITDPPSPDGSPNITSVSHNSVKVKFSGFEASHGPIKAYALILTTGDAVHPSADVLRYTYEDFKKGASDTYVTYLITTEEKRCSQGLSEVLKYEINVGNESTTHGYYNGKLEPLGSYRASVAGFTNITFNPHNDGLIDGAESYVSFSRYSDAVFLPQDPGVICGAVFGCIFGALVIVAVGGFLFWRKKRKDAKNNDVSFSQIKPKKSKLIKVENFEAYFKKQQADSNCGFAEEYEDLKLVGISLPKYAAELAENRGKNRYNNVLPYDISRVKLSVHAHSTDDYINANYMPGYHSKKDFIATQGPLPNTLKDFWRMVWEKNVYAIVMLTKCVEQGRTKCEEYWPSKQAQDYGDITVAMTSEIVLPEWTIRDFTVQNIQTSESHTLRQFHFTSWPDHGVPDTTDLLINFRYLVRDYMKQSPPESPILVHCSAGVGRTGTFIAIDRLIYQIEDENTVDVYGIVYDLRMHRPLMVQTEDQYVFLNQCVLDIIRSQKDSKVDLIYQNTTAMTIYENLAPVTAFGKTNGYIA